MVVFSNRYYRLFYLSTSSGSLFNSYCIPGISDCPYFSITIVLAITNKHYGNKITTEVKETDARALSPF